MSDWHDQIRQDLAAYALGALDPASTAAVESHLTICDECRALLDEYRQAVDMLPLAIETQAPPAGAGDRLLDAARATAPARGDARHSASRVWQLAAAASLILAIILGGLLVWLETRDDGREPLQAGTGERVIALSGSPDAPAASGHLVLDESAARATLVVANLPAVPEGRAYQFWFVGPGGERVSGAVFSTNPDGGAVIEIEVPKNVDWYERVGVTEEPEGGSPGPTGTNVLGGVLRASG